jgi:hypothetical protein
VTAADEQAMKERRTAVRGRMLVLVPLIAFLALAGLFMVRLGTGDPSRIPSALIGHEASGAAWAHARRQGGARPR